MIEKSFVYYSLCNFSHDRQNRHRPVVFKLITLAICIQWDNFRDLPFNWKNTSTNPDVILGKLGACATRFQTEDIFVSKQSFLKVYKSTYLSKPNFISPLSPKVRTATLVPNSEIGSFPITAMMKSISLPKSDFSVDPSTTKAMSMDCWQVPRIK